MALENLLLFFLGPLIVFHLIVDKKSKFSDFASGTMCVFNVQAKAWIPLTFDSRRWVVFVAFAVLNILNRCDFCSVIVK